MSFKPSSGRENQTAQWLQQLRKEKQHSIILLLNLQYRAGQKLQSDIKEVEAIQVGKYVRKWSMTSVGMMHLNRELWRRE